MVDDNPELIKEILHAELSKIESELLTIFPQGTFKEQLKSETRYNGDGRVDAVLSFHTNSHTEAESIDLILSIFCTQKGAVFASELAWSGGRTIEEVVVCEMCPDCLEDLHLRVGNLSERTRQPLVTRMTELFENFVN